jgi:hypothetical protein
MDLVEQVPQEPFDAASAVPPNDCGRDLVAEGREQEGGMAGDAGGLAADVVDDVAARSARVQEGNVLRPREPRDDSQTAIGSGVENINWWNRVCAYGIDARCRHQVEISRDARELGELMPVVPGRKGPVRDTAYEKWCTVDMQEFTARPDPARMQSGQISRWLWLTTLVGDSHSAT